MGSKLRRWRALPWSDRFSLILMMSLGLPAMSLSLRLFGYVRSREWLERRSVAHPLQEPTSADLDRAENLAMLANVAGRNGPVQATCLRQSLLIYYLLRRRKLKPELKIGVRKEGGELHAHAWVELAGRALAQGSLQHQPFEDAV
jgi:hypothetical protein